MCAPRAVLGPVKRGVTDTPRREKSCEARVSHHPLACARYFTPYTAPRPRTIANLADQKKIRSGQVRFFPGHTRSQHGDLSAS